MFSGYVVLNVIIHKLGNMLYLMFEIGLMSLLYIVIAQKGGFNIIVLVICNLYHSNHSIRVFCEKKIVQQIMENK